MSNCSSCVVAGSTMSANSAIRNELFTDNGEQIVTHQTGHSFSCSGQTTNGLELLDHQTLDSGSKPNSPVSAGPRRN